MSLLVSDAFNQIEQELNLIGQQVDQSDVFLYLTRAVNYFSTSYSLPTSKNIYDTLFFNGVREYPLPSDFGTLIEPRRSAALRSPDFTNTTDRELAHWPFGRQTAVQYDGATPFLEVVLDDVSPLDSPYSNCESTTGVTISGDGSSLSVDKQIYTEGLGSLRFQITAASGTTTLTFTGLNPIDISAWLLTNWNFLDLGCPSTNTSAIGSVKLRLGNDASNYYEMSATTRYRGQNILGGFGLIGFNFIGKTTVGTVTDTNIVWMQVVISNGLTGVNGIYHLDNIFTTQGFYYQVPYYSENNILTGNANPPVTPTNQVTLLTDIVLLPKECNEAVIYKALELIASSPNVNNQAFANYAARELKPKEDLLNSLYPLERSLVRSTWYKKWKFKGNGFQPQNSP